MSASRVIHDCLRQLYREKDRLDRAMVTLEDLSLGDRIAARKHKRGRKNPMTPEQRQEVGDRIRKYWAKRREQRADAASH